MTAVGTRVDFYIATRFQFLPLACRVIEKVYGLEHSVYVHTESLAQAKELDALLWSFKPDNFIPHELYEADNPEQQAAVLLGFEEPPIAADDVLVNLTDAVPVFFSRFSRVAEIVAPLEDKKKIARARFKYYRENGYVLQSHNL